jgi:DNA-binding NtrC family response regulator
VLVVQPEPAASWAWSNALREQGHHVVQAPAAPDSIAHIREGGIDVIVLDAVIGRPEIIAMMDALDRLPDAPPTVLLSGTPDGPELSARIGAAAFLPMPCDVDDLLREVGRITGGTVRSSQPLLQVPPLAFDDEPTGPSSERYPA